MMWILLLCATVFASAANSEHILEDRNGDQRLCDGDIPEDRSVEVGKECSSSVNCEQEGTECVFLRENYCECQVVEDRMKGMVDKKKKMGMDKKGNMKKWKVKRRRRMNKDCKKNGYSCVEKLKCENKYKRLEKKCKHPKHRCCSQCKNLKDHACKPKESCSKKLMKKAYQCGKKGYVCCRSVPCGGSCGPYEMCDTKKDKCVCKPGNHYHKYMKKCMPNCYGAPLCDETRHEYCDDTTMMCECMPPTVLSNSTCISVYTGFPDADKTWDEAVTFCEDRGGQLAMFKNKEEVSAFADLLLTFAKSNSVRYWIGIRDNGGKDYKFVDGTSASDILGIQTRSFLTDDDKLYWGDSWEIYPAVTDALECMTGYNGVAIPAVEDEHCSERRGLICQNVSE